MSRIFLNILLIPAVNIQFYEITVNYSCTHGHCERLSGGEIRYSEITDRIRFDGWRRPSGSRGR
jgi:hypothetical protein